MFILDVIQNRLGSGCETMSYPECDAPKLPPGHGGALRVEASKCDDACDLCVSRCPTEAIIRSQNAAVALDLGRCIFCRACVEVCPTGAISHTGDHRMAVRRREDLVLGAPGREEVRLASALDDALQRMFGRSLRLRQVSAGGCNACEAEAQVLTTIGWDVGRFGIQFVASPRHADGLLVTGPVTRNMELAVCKTYEAVPPPKIVIAMGACAIAGGPFIGLPEIRNGVESILPVDLFIPGCPPHPLTVLDGLLRLLARVASTPSRIQRAEAPPPAR